MMLHTRHMNICEQAEAFRLLLIMGLVSKRDVISWADDLIEAPPHVPEWVLDVSLAANDDDEGLESKLRDLPCEADCFAAAHSAIDRFADAFRSGTIAAR